MSSSLSYIGTINKINGSSNSGNGNNKSQTMLEAGIQSNSPMVSAFSPNNRRRNAEREAMEAGYSTKMKSYNSTTKKASPKKSTTVAVARPVSANTRGRQLQIMTVSTRSSSRNTKTAGSVRDASSFGNARNSPRSGIVGEMSSPLSRRRDGSSRRSPVTITALPPPPPKRNLRVQIPNSNKRRDMDDNL